MAMRWLWRRRIEKKTHAEWLIEIKIEKSSIAGFELCCFARESFEKVSPPPSPAIQCRCRHSIGSSSKRCKMQNNWIAPFRAIECERGERIPKHTVLFIVILPTLLIAQKFFLSAAFCINNMTSILNRDSFALSSLFFSY